MRAARLFFFAQVHTRSASKNRSHGHNTYVSAILGNLIELSALGLYPWVLSTFKRSANGNSMRVIINFE